MDIKEQLKEIKTQLRLSMNGVVSQSMREKGLNYKLNFGVELPRIKSIAAAYEKIPEVKKSIDDIPYNNRQLYAFSHILNKPFDEYIYMDVSTDTCFHKFTWKSSFYRTDANGHETLYGYLLRLYKQ